MFCASLFMFLYDLHVSVLNVIENNWLNILFSVPENLRIFSSAIQRVMWQYNKSLKSSKDLIDSTVASSIWWDRLNNVRYRDYFAWTMIKDTALSNGTVIHRYHTKVKEHTESRERKWKRYAITIVESKKGKRFALSIEPIGFLDKGQMFFTPRLSRHRGGIETTEINRLMLTASHETFFPSIFDF